MAEKLNVNPTRMELQKQKGRLRTAKRGHKLLKDKSDEMIRHFMVLAKQNKTLREEMDGKMSAALRMFALGSTQMSNQEVYSALETSPISLRVEPGRANIMGLWVPKFTIASMDRSSSHSMVKTTSGFDKGVKALKNLMERLLLLAEVEKSCDMLALEIIKIRRRINALEFILMPQIENTIRFIRMKLAENERSQLVRVMKIKAQTEGQK